MGRSPRRRRYRSPLGDRLSSRLGGGGGLAQAAAATGGVVKGGAARGCPAESTDRLGCAARPTLARASLQLVRR